MKYSKLNEMKFKEQRIKYKGVIMQIGISFNLLITKVSTHFLFVTRKTGNSN